MSYEEEDTCFDHLQKLVNWLMILGK
jgi:hypothetical protein